MGLSVSQVYRVREGKRGINEKFIIGAKKAQVYRVREGKRGINEKFIIGAKKAFPDHRLDELFYLDSGPHSGYMMETTVTTRYNHIVQRFTAPNF